MKPLVKESEVDDPEEMSARSRFQNVIDMGLDFSSMIRLFKKGSKGRLWKRLVENVAEKIFAVNSKEEFDRIHSGFCDWGTRNIYLAEKRRNDRIIKESKVASYGQLAKTLDVTLKVAIYYSHLPNCQKAIKISNWLNAAVDTQMMAMLSKEYPNDIRPWPNTVEEVDQGKYMELQKVIRKYIKEKHAGKIIPVQFDDIYWSKLNR